MGKLYETFTKIDGGRKKCIDSLRAKNVSIDNSANFDTIAESIRYAGEELDIVKDQHMWQRPEEWIDTEDLLLNAPTIDGYTAFAVYLLYDNASTMDLKLSGTTASYNAYDAYYLSDGTIYTTEKDGTSTITHTWDKTKDIKTNLGYNLRYAIEYTMNNKITKMNDYYSYVNFGDYDQLGIGKALLEVTARNLTTNGRARLEIPNCTSSGNITNNAESIHILASEVQFEHISGGSATFAIKEYKVDHIGSFKWNFYASKSSNDNNYVINNMKVFLPNVTELLVGSGGSSEQLCAAYISAPELLVINDVGNTQYGSINVNFLIAPKLKEVNKSVTINRNNLKYIPSVSSLNNISYNLGCWYKEELFSRVTDPVAALPSHSSYPEGVCYNETIEELTNTTNQGNYFILGVDLPNLKKIAFADTFKSTSSYTYTNWFVVGNGFKSSLNISNMNYLPGIYLHMLINNLADVTGEEETYTLSLGKILIVKLSDEQKAIATNKGWVIA